MAEARWYHAFSLLPWFYQPPVTRARQPCNLPTYYNTTATQHHASTMAAKNPSPRGPLLAQLCRLLPRASRLRRASTAPCTPETPRCLISTHAMVEYHNAIVTYNSINMPLRYKIIFSAQGRKKLTPYCEGESVLGHDFCTQQVQPQQVASSVNSTNACIPNRSKYKMSISFAC